MRAGLLSDPKIIALLNERFVSTSIIIDDLEKRAAGGDELAKQLAGHWKYPVEMMFVKPDRTLVSKLNSFGDFPGMHPDVSAPPGKKHAGREERPSHSAVFLDHVKAHFDVK